MAVEQGRRPGRSQTRLAQQFAYSSAAVTILRPQHLQPASGQPAGIPPAQQAAGFVPDFNFPAGWFAKT
jgi:hypothetical protein